MRRVSAFLRRYLPMILAVLVILAVVAVVWGFSAPIAQWSRSAQSFDAAAFLGEHLRAVALIGGCLLTLALIWLPKWQTARPELTPQARFEVENNARKTIAEMVGGAALLAGLYFTWSGLEVNREGQVTERFTRAIDQLGNDKLEIRLGGVYALERIARDSKKDHWPIMEVLTAYVRQRAPWVPEDAQSSNGNQLPQEAAPATLPIPPPPAPATPHPSLDKLVADIQAILTVLGRRSQTYGNGEEQPLNLADTELEGADLRGANLEEANLAGADLA